MIRNVCGRRPLTLALQKEGNANERYPDQLQRNGAEQNKSYKNKVSYDPI